MSDELKRLYTAEWKAAHPYPSKRDVDASERFLQALASLESQNQALQEALHGLLHALGAHAVTLGAVIDHMTQHECFCQQADALYRADAESGDALHAAVDRAKAALSPTQETDPE